MDDNPFNPVGTGSNRIFRWKPLQSLDDRAASLAYEAIKAREFSNGLEDDAIFAAAEARRAGLTFAEANCRAAQMEEEAEEAEEAAKEWRQEEQEGGEADADEVETGYVAQDMEAEAEGAADACWEDEQERGEAAAEEEDAGEELHTIQYNRRRRRIAEEEDAGARRGVDAYNTSAEGELRNTVLEWNTCGMHAEGKGDEECYSAWSTCDTDAEGGREEEFTQTEKELMKDANRRSYAKAGISSEQGTAMDTAMGT